MRIIPSKDAKASSSKQIITCGPDWTIQHWVIVFRIFSVSKQCRIPWLDLATESFSFIVASMYGVWSQAVLDTN